MSCHEGIKRGKFSLRQSHSQSKHIIILFSCPSKVEKFKFNLVVIGVRSFLSRFLFHQLDLSDLSRRSYRSNDGGYRWLLASPLSEFLDSVSPEREVTETRRGLYPPLFTDPEGDSCFSIYQIRWIKKCCFTINGHNFFFWNFHETTRHFSLLSQNSEYPRKFQVTGAN